MSRAAILLAAVLSLGSSKWTEREAGERALVRNGMAGRGVAVAIRHVTPDAEVAARCESVIRRTAPKVPKVWRFPGP